MPDQDAAPPKAGPIVPLKVSDSFRMMVKNSFSVPGDPTAVWLDVSPDEVLMEVHPTSSRPVRLGMIDLLSFRDSLNLIIDRGTELTMEEASKALGLDIVDPITQPL
jgi:hypothetical protein